MTYLLSVTDVVSYGDSDYDIAEDLENDRVEPEQTDQALAAHIEINLGSNGTLICTCKRQLLCTYL